MLSRTSVMLSKNLGVFYEGSVMLSKNSGVFYEISGVLSKNPVMLSKSPGVFYEIPGVLSRTQGNSPVKNPCYHEAGRPMFLSLDRWPFPLGPAYRRTVL
jgi:hypothetical protein